VDLKKLKNELIQDEGYREYPYRDTRGFWTGGIGRNLIAHGFDGNQIAVWNRIGIPEATIEEWFEQDLEAATECARKVFPTFGTLSDNVQRSLCNLAFCLMYELQDWHDLRAAVLAKDFQGAALSILGSRFAKEAPGRCGRLAARMVEG
jgi:GH24 family phage-related lysozyme (muramidase)